MFRKIVTAIIVVPLAAVIIAFAVANRQSVTVSFDPFSSASPAYTAMLPLFVVIFAALILGVLIGGIAAWIRQGKWRRAARKLDAEARELHQEIDAHPPPLRNGRAAGACAGTCPAARHSGADALTPPTRSALPGGGEGC